jgi:hypothetical protein
MQVPTSASAADTADWHSTHVNDTGFRSERYRRLFMRPLGFPVEEIGVFEVIDDPDQPEENQEIPLIRFRSPGNLPMSSRGNDLLLYGTALGIVLI